MAEQILLRIRPELARARQQVQELTRKTAEAKKARQDVVKERAKARTERAKAAKQRVRRGGRVVRGVGIAALAAVGVTLTREFLAPVIAAAAEEAIKSVRLFFPDEVKKILKGLGIDIDKKLRDLEDEIPKIRRSIEEMATFVSSTMAALSQTQAAINGLSLMGVNLDPNKIFEIGKGLFKVSYLQEAARASVASDMNAANIKNILEGLGASLMNSVKKWIK